LEGCRGVGKAVLYDPKLVQSITSSGCSLPFIAVCCAHEIVGAAKIVECLRCEIELGEDAGGAKTV